MLPSTLDDSEFDLRGFFVIASGLSHDELAAPNVAYDRFPPLDHGEWVGAAQRRDNTADTGFELHNVLDWGDPAFDVLIDQSGWIDHARRYAGDALVVVDACTHSGSTRTNA